MSQATAINTPEALFAKLERTFERRAAYGDDQLDWVFDFCITAWHLIDWVAISRAPTDPDAVKKFQADVRNRSPALAVCEQVCNGAKHLVLKDPRLSGFDVTAQVLDTGGLAGFGIAVATAGPPTEAELTKLSGESIVCTPSIVITDRTGSRWNAIGLFFQVLAFWRLELGLTSRP